MADACAKLNKVSVDILRYTDVLQNSPTKELKT